MIICLVGWKSRKSRKNSGKHGFKKSPAKLPRKSPNLISLFSEHFGIFCTFLCFSREEEKRAADSWLSHQVNFETRASSIIILACGEASRRLVTTQWPNNDDNFF